MSLAKQKFDKTINRCNELISIYESLKAENPDANISQDILRSAIVLAVAAFDAYATDCFAEHFVDYIKRYKIDDELEKLLIDAGFTVSFALELIKMERPYRRIRTLIDKYYCKYTTQKLCVIDELFKHYHIKNLTKNAAKRSKKSPQRLISSIEKIIERRHSIVHDGDYNEYNRIIKVTDTDIGRIGDLQILVSNMEDIINNKFNPSKG